MGRDNLAMNGGPAAVTRPFPRWPFSDWRESQRLEQVLQGESWWRVGGSQVVAFERDFAAAHGGGLGLAVTNGTHALELALRTLGVGPGDEVIIPSLTFVSTVTAVFMVFAQPRRCRRIARHVVHRPRRGPRGDRTPHPGSHSGALRRAGRRHGTPAKRLQR